jgi:hypothetical protein
MPTFLTTATMDPALAARVEASVTGRRPRLRAASGTRRIVAVARFVLVLTVAFGIYVTVSGRRRQKEELDAARAALLDTVAAESASLGPDDLGAVTRIESWLVRQDGTYPEDVVADELRAPGGLARALARPLVYVRGPLGAFAGTRALAEVSARSFKDPLLLCLLDPPPARLERTMLDPVRLAYTGGAAMEARSAHVRRVNDAVVGLPLLAPEWAARVRAAKDAREIARLRGELERGVVARAKQAARAEVLLAAIDEPGDPASDPTELDGERRHAVRVVLVDLGASKVLLRTRKIVDPAWISVAKRPVYAAGLDGCALAFDIHEEVRAGR